jgi:glycosyltransferase involved in cell wall biosynthesis
VLKKRDIREKLEIMPPWPHDDLLEVVAHETNPFREQHQLQGKFVVMYSGNHGPSNPIRTAIEGAKKLRHRPDIVFMFIGGGIQKKEVEAAIAAGATNIVSLPYRSLDQIKYSLSAADVHLVTVGNEIVGIVHPCKVYGSMAVARPVLLLGPSPSHVADLLEKHGIGWQASHGDVEEFVRTVETAAATPRPEREAMGRTAKRIVEEELGMAVLCRRFGDIVEHGPLPREATAPSAAAATGARPSVARA